MQQQVGDVDALVDIPREFKADALTLATNATHPSAEKLNWKRCVFTN